jgi:hypothetical protein
MKLTQTLVALPLIFAGVANATVDVQDRVTIVSEDIQAGGYFTQSVPAEYCMGILPYSLAQAITRPVIIQDNYGCGSDSSSTKDVNAASCAVIHAEEVERNGEIISDEVNLKIDTSKCSDAKIQAFNKL